MILLSEPRSYRPSTQTVIWAAFSLWGLPFLTTKYHKNVYQPLWSDLHGTFVQLSGYRLRDPARVPSYLRRAGWPPQPRAARRCLFVGDAYLFGILAGVIEWRIGGSIASKDRNHLTTSRENTCILLRLINVIITKAENTFIR